MKYLFYLLVAFICIGNTTSAQKNLIGNASFYHNKFNGRKTASGEIFSNEKLTCACNKLPLGTYLKVTNIHNQKQIIVKVNDRLAAHNKRLVDLTKYAAKQLDFMSKGFTKVQVEVVNSDSKEIVEMVDAVKPKLKKYKKARRTHKKMKSK